MQMAALDPMPMKSSAMKEQDVHRRSAMLPYASIFLGSMAGPVGDLPKSLHFLAIAGEKQVSHSGGPRLRVSECIMFAKSISWRREVSAEAASDLVSNCT